MFKRGTLLQHKQTGQVVLFRAMSTPKCALVRSTKRLPSRLGGVVYNGVGELYAVTVTDYDVFVEAGK